MPLIPRAQAQTPADPPCRIPLTAQKDGITIRKAGPAAVSGGVQLKALLRKAAARTVDDLHQAVANAIDAITPAECVNYFKACGYDPD